MMFSQQAGNMAAVKTAQSIQILIHSSMVRAR